MHRKQPKAYQVTVKQEANSIFPGTRSQATLKQILIMRRDKEIRNGASVAMPSDFRSIALTLDVSDQGRVAQMRREAQTKVGLVEMNHEYILVMTGGNQPGCRDARV